VVLVSTEITNVSPPQAPVGEDGKFAFKSVAPDHYLVSVQSVLRRRLIGGVPQSNPRRKQVDAYSAAETWKVPTKLLRRKGTLQVSSRPSPL
jgi:hypothetical protein